MFDLTKKQYDILCHIRDYKESNDGLSPTYREMAESFGISIKGISDHVKAIERKGYIKSEPRKQGIKIIKKEFILETYGR